MGWKIGLAALAFGLVGGLAQAGSRPVVVELFTSQGCSSCPPADTLLGELAQRGDVIALAYHVDYWNNLGWKDPFATAGATLRQRRYAGPLGLTGIYTPQMVVDGAVDVVGSDRRAVYAALAGQRQGPSIQLAAADGKLKIAVSASQLASAADVTLVAYTPEAETKVMRGENAGRSLREYSIVRGVYPLGAWRGDAAAFDIDLSAIDENATMAAVLVQAANQGKMIGAMTMRIR